MDTVIKKIMHDDSDDEIYEQAAEILKNGGLVAFPYRNGIWTWCGCS